MGTSKTEKIVILGISDRQDRYSFKAYQKLLLNGYTNLVGVSPKKVDLGDIKLLKSLEKFVGPLHTLTLYVGAERLTPMIEQILKLAPKRIISNPGTENDELIAKAQAQGIEVVEGCTLVMLSTDQF